MVQKKYWIALNMIPEIGSIVFGKLIAYFGSPEKVFFASLKEMRKVSGLREETIERIIKTKEEIDLSGEISLIKKYDVNILTLEEENYPSNLKTIYAPPPVIYVKGQILEKDRFAVAVVGSRRATTYGKITTERLSGELAERGITLISGMARGIDTSAHKGVLARGGRTIAVLGSGINVVYPPENKGLMGEIAKSGAVISEFPMSTVPDRLNFPLRNRIISGLSLGVVVVEAAERSGALITADYALEQGREVFAVPGSVNARSSKGTHNLIKMGAKLVETSEDIIEELEPQLRGLSKVNEVGEKKEKIPFLKEEECKVLHLLSQEPQHIDEIIQVSKMNAHKVASLLVMLEIKGLIRQLSGKMFIKK